MLLSSFLSRQPSPVLLVLLAFAAVGGCRPSETVDVDNQRDGGPAKKADAKAPSGPASAVTGRQVGIYVGEQEDREGIINLTDAKVAAWSLSADGQYKYFPGSGNSDGDIMVPDVPAGPFLLRFGNSYFASSSAREFDFSFISLGRQDRPWATTRPTTLSLNLTGLNPWVMGDELHFYSPAVPAGEGGVNNRITPAPALSGTSVIGSGDYVSFNTPALLDGPGRGDEAWFVQRSWTTTEQGHRYLSIKKYLRTKSLAVTNGQPAALTGVMVDPPVMSTLNVDWPSAEYQTLMKSVSPVAERMRGDIHVLTTPGMDRFGDYGWGGPLLYSHVQSPASLEFVARYADPYPPEWGRVAAAYMFYTVQILIPGAGTPGEVTARIFVNDTVEAFNSGPIKPIITPPRDPKINGQPAFEEATGVTATPLVSWSAPATGKPSVYKVYVLLGRASQGRVNWSTLATIYSGDTSVRIPPDILQFGESYVLIIEALVEGDVSVTKPFRRALRRGYAQMVTARLTP